MLQLQQVTQRTYFFSHCQIQATIVRLAIMLHHNVCMSQQHSIHDDALEPILQSRDFTDVRIVRNLLSVS